MGKRRNNCKPARGVSTGKMTKAAWQTFDALPRDVRAAMWETPIPINPISVAEALQHSHPAAVVRRIKDSSLHELALFAEEHWRRHGCELPHVAASVSVQRYDEHYVRPRPRNRYAVIQSRELRGVLRLR